MITRGVIERTSRTKRRTRKDAERRRKTGKGIKRDTMRGKGTREGEREKRRDGLKSGTRSTGEEKGIGWKSQKEKRQIGI